MCLGKGEVLVRLPIQNCKRCNGSGRAITSDPFLIVKDGHRLCSLCSGAGWLFAPATISTLPRRAALGLRFFSDRPVGTAPRQFNEPLLRFTTAQEIS